MPRTLDRLLDLRAGRFDQPSVLHSRRARRFAAAARQAEIEMLDVRRIDLRCARCHLHHLVDAAARRIHLHAQLAIRGAVVQAQTAVDAAVEIRLLRSVMEPGRQMRPYNLPRFKRAFGSNNCLIFCITGKVAARLRPQRKDCFAASGANSIAPF